MRGAANWDALSPELKGRIFCKLDDIERCRIAPFLSHACRQAHRDYPPKRKEYTINMPVSHPLASWILHAYAPTMEVLVFDRSDAHAVDFLPQLLAMAGSAAPHLGTICLRSSDPEKEGGTYRTEGEILSMAYLTAVTSLELQYWSSPHGESDQSITQLSGLSSLQTLHLEYFDYSKASAKQSKALWSTLASLKGLKEIAIESLSSHIDESFLVEVSRMTQLRDLWLGDCVEKCHLDGDSVILRGISHLSQLIKLTLEICLPLASMHNVAELPLLEELSLRVGKLQAGASLCLKSTSLNSLQLLCIGESLEGLSSLDQLLSVPSPALPHLATVEASHLGLDTISLNLAAALSNLTRLDLKGNRMRALPPALSQLTALVSLDVAGNKDLQLKEDDVKVLAGLPHLQTFGFAKEEPDHGWSQQSLEVLFGIKNALPDLQMNSALDGYNVLKTSK